MKVDIKGLIKVSFISFITVYLSILLFPFAIQLITGIFSGKYGITGLALFCATFCTMISIIIFLNN